MPSEVAIQNAYSEVGQERLIQKTWRSTIILKNFNNDSFWILHLGAITPLHPINKVNMIAEKKIL